MIPITAISLQCCMPIEENTIGRLPAFSGEGILNAVIEISAGTSDKYEYDPATRRIRFDRMLFSSVHYPCDYGFVPETLADDGHEVAGRGAAMFATAAVGLSVPFFFQSMTIYPDGPAAASVVCARVISRVGASPANFQISLKSLSGI